MSKALKAKAASRSKKSGSFFGLDKPIRYEGQNSKNPLAFRWYDPNKKVLGKKLSEQLRMAVCYWHTFCWGGGDPFGGSTLIRPWFDTGDALGEAKMKADVAFEMFDALGVPFFCFHDRDIAPEGNSLKESNKYVRLIADIFAKKMETSKTRLLWGTANLFSHRRYMAGAATNPDVEIFTYAAAQVKNCIDVTKMLGGANYVLWGGREGYETLLNTDLGHEMDQIGRFMNMVVDYKHKIGFKGTILIEPKPQEPTKHQYDFDSATVYGFLKKYGLEKEIKLNIEAGHAFLAGHTFEHEIAVACANGILGSIDMNRNDLQSGWDTDQFPNNILDVALPYYHILKNGGFATGGTNFDAKIRRQSLDPLDLIYGHIGGMDTCARALLAAAAMIEDGSLDKAVKARYASWKSAEGKAILGGKRTLEDLAAAVDKKGLNPQPVSGQQEYLENLVNRFV